MLFQKIKQRAFSFCWTTKYFTNHSSLNIRPSSRIFRFFEVDMFHIKLPIFETKLQLKLQLLWTANKYYYYHWLPTFPTSSFHCPDANFYHSPYIPIPNTRKAANNISIKNWVNDVKRIKLKSFLTTLFELKSKLIVLSWHEQLPATSWRIVWTILYRKTSASLVFQSKLIALSSQNNCLPDPDKLLERFYLAKCQSLCKPRT